MSNIRITSHYDVPLHLSEKEREMYKVPAREYQEVMFNSDIVGYILLWGSVGEEEEPSESVGWQFQDIYGNLHGPRNMDLCFAKEWIKNNQSMIQLIHDREFEWCFIECVVDAPTKLRGLITLQNGGYPFITSSIGSATIMPKDNALKCIEALEKNPMLPSLYYGHYSDPKLTYEYRMIPITLTSAGGYHGK